MKKLITLFCFVTLSYMANAQCPCDSLGLHVANQSVTDYYIASGQNAQMVFTLTNTGVDTMHYVRVNTGHNSNFTLFGFFTDSISALEGSCSYLTEITDTILNLTGLNIPPGDSTFLHVCFRGKCSSDSQSDLDFIFTYGCDSTHICTPAFPLNPNFYIAGRGHPHLLDSALTNANIASYGLPGIINSSNSNCSGVGDTATFAVKYLNDGPPATVYQPGFSNAMKIKIILAVNNEFGTIDPTSFKLLQTAGDTLIHLPNYLTTVITGTGVDTGIIFYKIDFSLLAVAGSDTIPFGENTLRDIDHDGYVDDLGENKSFILFFNYVYNDTCPDSFAIVNTSKDMVIQSGEKYNNQCGTLRYVSTIDTIHATPFIMTDYSNYTLLYHYQSGGATVSSHATLSAPADVDESLNPHINIHLCPEFGQGWSPDNFEFKCTDGYHKVHIMLPPGFHLDTDTLLAHSGYYDSITIVTNVTNACNNPSHLDTVLCHIHETPAVSCDTAGYIDIEIYPNPLCKPYHTFHIPCFDVPLVFNCGTSVCPVINYPDSTSTFKDTVEYVCCPTCIDKLTAASGFTYTHCNSGCNPTDFSTSSPFTFKRTTLGWVNTNDSLGYNCSTIDTAVTVPINSMIRINRAYPGDAMEATMQGDFTGNGSNYSHIYFRIKYNDLGTASALSSIFDLDPFINSTINITWHDTSGNPHLHTHILLPTDYTVDTTTAQVKMKFNLDSSFVYDSLNIAYTNSSGFHLDAAIHLVVKSTNVNNPVRATGCNTFFTGGRHPLINLREELMGEADTASVATFYRSCDSWGANDTILQPSVNFSGGAGTTACDEYEAKFIFSSTGALFTLYGEEDFPHEFRPYAKLNDNFTIIIPPGFTYDSSTFVMMIDNYSGIAINYFNNPPQIPSSPVTLFPTVAANTLTFNGLNGSCFPLLDPKFLLTSESYYIINVYLKHDCGIADTSQLTVLGNYTENIQHQDTAYTDYYQNTTPIINAINTGLILHNQPSLTLTSVEGTSTDTTITTGFKICSSGDVVAYPYLIIVPHSYFFTALTFSASFHCDASYTSIPLHTGATADTLIIDPIGATDCICFKVTGLYNGLACTSQLDSGLYHINLYMDLNYSCTPTGPQCTISHDSLQFLVAPDSVTTNPSVTATNETICAGGTATLTASGATTYLWSTADTINPIFVSPVVTSYYSVTGFLNGCPGSASDTVIVKSLPVFTVNSPSICIGDTVTLIATSTNYYNYVWSTTATTDSISVFPSSTTSYTVTATDTLTGCSDSLIVNVKVNPLPTVTVNSDTICSGQTVILIADGASAYLWSTLDTTYSISVSPMTDTIYTVTGTDANGCSASAVATVTVQLSPTVTLTSDTICEGDTAHVVAGGAYTYMWSAGLDSTGVNSADAAPTVTSYYSVIGTAINGCTGTAKDSVVVHKLPNIIVSSQKICVGDTAELTAGGASTYLWSTADTTSTIFVAPDSTTLYTVTATDSNHCSSSAIATVTVNQKPIIGLIGDSIACLSGTILDYSIDNFQSGTTYTVSLDSVFGIASLVDAMGSFTLVWYDTTVAVGTSITITSTDTSCKFSYTFKIAPCCTVSGIRKFENDSASTMIRENFGYDVSYGLGWIVGQTFMINGNFYVDTTMTFKNCEVYMGPNAKINILSNMGLGIQNSHLHACSYMWDGMYASGTSSGFVISKSLIEDARSAVNADSGATMEDGLNVFNKNYRSINITNYAGCMNNPCMYFNSETIFTCRDFSSYNSSPAWQRDSLILYDYSSSNNRLPDSTKTVLIAPYSGKRAHIGQRIANITNADPYQLGDTAATGPDNIYDYLDYGIKAEKSNVKIRNNLFVNISTIRYCRGCKADSSSCAIFAIQTPPETKKLIVGGMGVNEPNSFDTCSIGVQAICYNSQIIDNNFYNIRDFGVFINTGFNKLINVTQNKMDSVNYGVYCYDIPSDTTNITENKINVYATGGGGIYVGNVGVATDTVLKISNNIINMDDGGVGIEARVQLATIDHDTVNFNTTAFTSMYWGIMLEGCDTTTVRENLIQQTSVVPYNTLADTLYGIYVNTSTRSYVYKNILNNMGSGIYAVSSCNNSMFACNDLDSCWFGFNFDGANIGPQFPVGAASTGNQWNNNIYSLGWITGILTPTTYWYYSPSFNPFFHNSCIGDTLISSTYDSCGSLYLRAPITPEMRESRLGRIVRGENDTLSSESKLRDSIYAFKTLKSNPGMLSLGTSDDTIYQKFYDSTKNANIGKFQKVKDLIKDSVLVNAPQATIINQNINTTHLMEDNLKIVNSIYLNEIAYNTDTTHNTKYRYDSTELAELQNIAYQNPKTGGNAVFMARTMLFINVNDNGMSEKSLVTKTTPTKKLNKTENYRLYPNPNNGNMQLSYSLASNETGYLNLYNAQVEQVGTYKLISGDNILTISETQLEDGVYFYAVFVNNKKVFGDRIVIIK